MYAKTIPTFLFASVALFATQAGAGTVAFHYKESELASTAGLNAVYSRIQSRADSACATNDPRALWRRNAEARCSAQLVEDIVSKIDHAGLSAAHVRAAGANRFAIRGQ